MENTNTDDLPIAVIGAGPVGLAAAAHLVERGLTPVVLEAGNTAGVAILSWGHVRVFSPWKYMVDPAARRLLEASGWVMPDAEALPTGAEFVESYLQPLADLPQIAPHLRYDHRVTTVTRAGFDRVRSADREAAPFELESVSPAGERSRIRARAVIDASGTLTRPNPLGASGVPAVGEAQHRTRIFYGIPDVLGRDRARYAAKRTLVVGSGHSAFNALIDLAWLKLGHPATQIVWAVRRAELGLLYGGGGMDALPARGSLGARLRQLVELGVVEMHRGFRASRVIAHDEGVLVGSEHHTIGPVDEIVVATGYRPELEMLHELRLALDPVLESPSRLAPLIDPNVHSCGTVHPHGYAELAHPEADFYIVGMKSYGRAPTFLMLTGYEQVRSVVSALAGDLDAARSVELVLPETGVCSSDLVGGTACCSSAAAPAAAAGPTGGTGCGCG